MTDRCVHCDEPLSYTDAAGAMGNTPETFTHPGCHKLSIVCYRRQRSNDNWCDHKDRGIPCPEGSDHA